MRPGTKVGNGVGEGVAEAPGVATCACALAKAGCRGKHAELWLAMGAGPLLLCAGGVLSVVPSTEPQLQSEPCLA
jgi:hypothetical protein